MWADLHTHTTASDGTVNPSELVRAAAIAGLSAVGITDHDTLDGLAEAERSALETGIEVIPGVEINTDSATDSAGAEIHVLGYFVGRENSNIRALLGNLKESRIQRGKEMTALLRKLGYRIAWEQVFEAAGGGVIGRPHLARVLKKTGQVRSTHEAFSLLLARGRPAYVPRAKLVAADAVRAIRNAGGVAVLAHPGHLGRRAEDIIHSLIPDGLQGIEVFHPDHDCGTTARLADAARRLGLLVTGGSDHHGSERSALGAFGINREDTESLKRAASRNRFAD